MLVSGARILIDISARIHIFSFHGRAWAGSVDTIFDVTDAYLAPDDYRWSFQQRIRNGAQNSGTRRQART